MNDVVNHPAAALMAEVAEERAIADTPEAQDLVSAICKATSAYWDYLERSGLIYDDKRDLMRASALHIIYDGWSGWEFILKDGRSIAVTAVAKTPTQNTVVSIRYGRRRNLPARAPSSLTHCASSVSRLQCNAAKVGICRPLNFLPWERPRWTAYFGNHCALVA